MIDTDTLVVSIIVAGIAAFASGYVTYFFGVKQQRKFSVIDQLWNEKHQEFKELNADLIVIYRIIFEVFWIFKINRGDAPSRCAKTHFLMSRAQTSVCCADQECKKFFVSKYGNVEEFTDEQLRWFLLDFIGEEQRTLAKLMQSLGLKKDCLGMIVVDRRMSDLIDKITTDALEMFQKAISSGYDNILNYTLDENEVRGIRGSIATLITYEKEELENTRTSDFEQSHRWLHNLSKFFHRR